MEKLKRYVGFPGRKMAYVTNSSPLRLIQEEMRNLKDLTREWMAVQPLDYEQYYKMVGQVFQNTNDAITSFQVRILILI